MSGDVSNAPPIWIHLLLTLMSSGLALFLLAGLVMGDCTFPDQDLAQQSCLAGKRVALATHPLGAALLVFAGRLLRRKWGAWSMVLTILAAPIAFAIALVAETIAI